MPWPTRYRLPKSTDSVAVDQPVRVDTSLKATRSVKAVNRHSTSHQHRVLNQAITIAAQEREERLYPLRPLKAGEVRRPGAKPAAGVRYPDESHLALAVCNAYLRLYPKRSLARVYSSWHEEEMQQGRYDELFTLDTLKSWSRRYHWQARALLFDARPGSVMHELIQTALQMQRDVERFLASPEGAEKRKEIRRVQRNEARRTKRKAEKQSKKESMASTAPTLDENVPDHPRSLVKTSQKGGTTHRV